MTASTDDDFFCFGLFKDTCEQLEKEEVNCSSSFF
jgi:hypothetical protein